jgi:Protein of unknown function (DUF1326)
MKIFCLVLSLVAGIGLLNAGSTPSGQVVELHACEVYTGGCTASAQATMGGRSMLRVWSFENGAYSGVELAGLQMAALQIADKNLAFTDTQPSAVVVYLPSGATDVQRRALTSWLKSNSPEIATVRLIEKLAPISYTQKDSRISVRVGEEIALQTRALASCDRGGCGESLWYQPRSKTGNFTVLVNENSSVSEPILSLVWKDNTTKSVFFARFGDDSTREFHLAALE